MEASSPLGLQDQPNNPAVLTRLAAIGVTLSPDEADTVRRLRKLRNNLQHSSARFSHRQILTCAAARSGTRQGRGQPRGKHTRRIHTPLLGSLITVGPLEGAEERDPLAADRVTVTVRAGK
jgi:hypothetical protein